MAGTEAMAGLSVALKVVRTIAVIEILSFGVGLLIAIYASIKETEIWSSTCTPLNPDSTCPPETTCPPDGAACPTTDPSSWDEGRLEAVWENIRFARPRVSLRACAAHAPSCARLIRANCRSPGGLSSNVAAPGRFIGLIFMGFAAWSFINFGQQVKQRVGERDWFTRHPDAFQTSARLNFYFLTGFAALLLIAAVLLITAPDSMLGFIEGVLDVGFDDAPGAACPPPNAGCAFPFYQLRSEYQGTHCSDADNMNEPSCDESWTLEVWIQWFFLNNFTSAGLFTFCLFVMVAVWAYCVKKLGDHADDPAWQEAISGKRLYAGKVERQELDSILTAEQGGGAQRSDAGASVV